MPNYEENKYFSDVVKYDIQEYSRDEAVIASGAGQLGLGTVLSKNTNGKYGKLNPTASSGEQVATAVLLSNIDATDEEVKSVILSRHAGIVESGLEWPDGITDAQKLTAISELAAVGIIIRKEA